MSSRDSSTESDVTPLAEQSEGDPRRWFGLGVVLLAAIVDFVDATMTAVAAPSVQADLGGGETLMQWLAAAYTLAFACVLITGGRLGDVHGRRRMLVVGAIGFTLSSVACGLASGPEVIIGARLVQGLFAGLMIPQGLGMLKQIFPAKQLPAAFGFYGAAIGLASVAGPIVAGGLIGADLFGTGWRMIFWINVPLGVLIVMGAFRFLPETRSGQVLRLDLVGTGLITTCLVLLMFPLVEGRELGWPPWMFGMMLGAGLFLALFVRHEFAEHRAGRNPLIALEVFHRRAFSGGLVLGLVVFCATSGLMLILGMFVQIGLGYSALVAGFTLLPLAFGSTVGSGIGTALVAKMGRKVLQLGLLTVFTGALLLLLTLQWVDIDVSPWLLAPALLVLGTGMGMVFAPFFDIVLGGVANNEVGSASGTLSAVQQLGNATGAAVLGTVFFAAAGTLAPEALMDSMTVVLWLEIVLVLLSLGLSFLLPRQARQDAQLAVEE